MDQRLHRAIEWRSCDSRVFMYAARIDGQWWVLRLNDFPEHPLFTLFIDRECIGDSDVLPPTWTRPPKNGAPPLNDTERAEMLAMMTGLGPYGVEAGQPCDGDWCNCRFITDESAARR